jgi:1-(5-phosphoribosyl)-5-[(5-phosphoribosylamino)methylideneamino] imidazole-4-carboxamide isomerase/N-(5'phosphoribosyl)anthranilate isomerase
MKVLELYPAVDVKNGRAARLRQGHLSTIEDYGDPAEVITQFIDDGSKWIHLVDLDAAFGTGSNSTQIKDLAAMENIDIQFSGGIKDQDTLDFGLSTSAKQINLATSALLNLDWIAKVLDQHGDKLSISLDVQSATNQLIARGSGEKLGDLFEMIRKLDSLGCARYILTDINTDGALSGPNFDLLEKVANQTDTAIIASGGVSTIEDLARLRKIELNGVVLGKALYQGRIDLASALITCYK